MPGLRFKAAGPLFGLALALAGPAAAIERLSGEHVNVTGQFGDLLFAAGRTVDAAFTSSDDAYLAGREVHVGAASADHLFLAAGAASVDGAQAKDLVGAAGELTLESGQAARHLVAAAGRLSLRPSFRVGGSAMLSGGRIEAASPIGGDLVVKGGTVRLDGPIAGKAEVAADHLVVGPKARIGGDLIYTAGAAEIDPAAVIQGQRIARPPPAAPAKAARSGLGAAVMAAVVFAVGAAILVLVLAVAFPGLMASVGRRIDARPAPTLGVGFLLMAAGPVAVAVLFVTLVGAPLALLVAALYAVTVPFALAAVVSWAGLRARRASARGRTLEPPSVWARFGWSLLAIVVLLILGAIPILGGVLWLVVYILGLGAVAIEARRALAREGPPAQTAVATPA